VEKIGRADPAGLGFSRQEVPGVLLLEQADFPVQEAPAFGGNRLRFGVHAWGGYARPWVEHG
jgi:hypothetical protein